MHFDNELSYLANRVEIKVRRRVYDYKLDHEINVILHNMVYNYIGRMKSREALNSQSDWQKDIQNPL